MQERQEEPHPFGSAPLAKESGELLTAYFCSRIARTQPPAREFWIGIDLTQIRHHIPENCRLSRQKDTRGQVFALAVQMPRGMPPPMLVSLGPSSFSCFLRVCTLRSNRSLPPTWEAQWNSGCLAPAWISLKCCRHMVSKSIDRRSFSFPFK